MAEETGTGGWRKVADTKYVRLREGVDIQADLDSGWAISGLDVKEMPDQEDEPGAYGFVKSKINAGVLEPASRAEYEEVQKHEGSAEAPQQIAVVQTTPHNEQDVLDRAKSARRKVQKRREDNTGEDSLGPVGSAFLTPEEEAQRTQEQFRALEETRVSEEEGGGGRRGGKGK